MKTITELKELHLLKTKVRSDVQKRISKQLNRVCGFKDCDNSLAFKYSTAVYCSRGCLAKEKARVKNMNRQKKKNYYAKHGIKFDKTIRNRKTAVSAYGVAYDGRTLVYENYKEPLKPIEKAKGYGYYGTVGLTDDGQNVQCHICGNLFPNVSAHLRKHKITAEKYKEMFELDQSTALISEPERMRKQKQVFEQKLGNKSLPDHLKVYNDKVKSGAIEHKGPRHRGMTLEKRNKLGLCPEQVLMKIQELADLLGKTPSHDEFKSHYNYRYLGSIKFLHGSYSEAVKKLGMTTRQDLYFVDESKLIQELRDFKEKYGRIPMTSDFNRGLLRDRGTYTRTFGTLNNARIEAGMDAVIPMPFGQIKLLSPEEYIKYKNGHSKRKTSSMGVKGYPNRKLVES